MTDDELEAIEDEILLAEVQRRVVNDNGIRHDLADVIKKLGFTEEELAETEENQ